MKILPVTQEKIIVKILPITLRKSTNEREGEPEQSLELASVSHKHADIFPTVNSKIFRENIYFL